MKLDFNISQNTYAANAANFAATARADSADAAAKTAATPAQGFSITERAASPEDIEAARIPETALARDDALGRLVSSAYNLPAPPMPAFV